MKYLIFCIITVFFSVTVAGKERVQSVKPVVYIIGDSTVKNGKGDGTDGMWGWGDKIAVHFDTAKVRVDNHALGGTSSRTFRTRGLWDAVLHNIRPGDYVLMQFGHNDAGPVNDTIRARGTIRGTGDETEGIDNLLTGQHEIIHTYGWYIRQFILETKHKGGIPVVISPIPRNRWDEGKVIRNNDTYGKWAREAAKQEKAAFIDLNEKMAQAMEEMGETKAAEILFTPKDNTHPCGAGAELAASLVAEGLRETESRRLMLENVRTAP